MATFFAAVTRHLYGEAEERRSIRSILLGPPGAGKGIVFKQLYIYHPYQMKQVMSVEGYFSFSML